MSEREPQDIQQMHYLVLEKSFSKTWSDNLLPYLARVPLSETELSIMALYIGTEDRSGVSKPTIAKELNMKVIRVSKIISSVKVKAEFLKMLEEHQGVIEHIMQELPND